MVRFLGREFSRTTPPSPPPRELPRPPLQRLEQARLLLAARGAEPSLELPRRRWLQAQVAGLRTTSAKLTGQAIDYADEVEACYGVRPEAVDEEVFAAAHRSLAEA